MNKKKILIFIFIFIILIFFIIFLKNKIIYNIKMGTYHYPIAKQIAKAIKAKDVDKVKLLVANADINDLNMPSSASVTLISLTIFEALNDKEYTANIKEFTGDTKIDPKYEVIITDLVKAGADPSTKEGNADYLQNAMLYAIQTPMPDQILKALLAGGADPDYKKTPGEPLINLVASTEEFSKFKLLVEYGAKINYEPTIPPVVSPLIQTSLQGNPLATLYLLEKGADPYNISGYGDTLAIATLKSIFLRIKDLQKLESENKSQTEAYQKHKNLLKNYVKVRDFLINKKGAEWPPILTEEYKEKYSSAPIVTKYNDYLEADHKATMMVAEME